MPRAGSPSLSPAGWPEQVVVRRRPPRLGAREVMTKRPVGGPCRISGGADRMGYTRTARATLHTLGVHGTMPHAWAILLGFGRSRLPVIWTCCAQVSDEKWMMVLLVETCERTGPRSATVQHGLSLSFFFLTSHNLLLLCGISSRSIVDPWFSLYPLQICNRNG